MEAIKLTEDHKSMLLEMCEKLFPEYPGLVVRNSMEDFNLDQDDCFIELKEFGNSSPSDTIIHWFEFCMTHLAEKIIATYTLSKDNERIYKRTLNDDLSKLYLESLLFSRGFDKSHPVDYLYQQFKELNL